MKKLTRCLLALCLCALTLTLLLTACGSKRGYATIVIGDSDHADTVIEVNLDKVDGWDEKTASATVENVLKSLQADGKLTYTAENGDYGWYLTAIGEVKQDAENGKYLCFWTNVAAEQDTSDFGTTKEYGEASLRSAAVGASTATVSEGTIIYFGTVQY